MLKGKVLSGSQNSHAVVKRTQAPVTPKPPSERPLPVPYTVPTVVPKDQQH